MADKRKEAGDTPVPTTENEAQPTDASQSDVTLEQWPMMQNILTTIYNHRTENGYDPSRLFHRKVNKRAIPAYYEIIKEPIALSTIKAKINTKAYKNFPEFVRDFALISHNAQVYNRPDSGAYQDALVIKGVLEAELHRLVEKKAISDEDAKLPDLGEIPSPDEGVDEDVEEEDDGDDEDEPKKRGRGRPPKDSQKQDGDPSDEEKSGDDGDNRKKRNRPPRVDTPTEARIKNIIKILRRAKNTGGHMKMAHFERLPDKQQMPDYFLQIKYPIAVDTLKASFGFASYTLEYR